MFEELSLENIKNLFEENKESFVEHKFENGSTFVSTHPFVFYEARFRLTLFFENTHIASISLIAVKNQLDDRYKNLSTQNIHEKWLKDLLGEPYKYLAYGIVYTFKDMTVLSEHDCHSGSDIISISYYDV